MSSILNSVVADGIRNDMVTYSEAILGYVSVLLFSFFLFCNDFLGPAVLAMSTYKRFSSLPPGGELLN